MFSEIAYAMGGMAPQGGQAGGAAGIAYQFGPIILIIAVFYFVLIRPQQKKAKQHQEMLQNLKKGDAVITNGGMYGRIVDFQDEAVIVDLGDQKVYMLRGALNVLPANQKSPIAFQPKKAEKKKSAPAAEKAADTNEDSAENEE